MILCYNAQDGVEMIEKQMTKLEKVYAYWKLLKEYQGNKINSTELEYKLFGFMIYCYGCNKKPQIIKDDDFDKEFGFEEFRGMKKIEYHANLLDDFHYRYGKGNEMNGIFVTPVPYLASQYVIKDHFENILKLKIAGKIATMDFFKGLIEDNLTNKDVPTRIDREETRYQRFNDLVDFLKSISKEDRQDFVSMLRRDVSKLAIVMGYDAVYDPEYPCFAIVNRNAIKVSEYEYSRIMNASGKGSKKTAVPAHTLNILK